MFLSNIKELAKLILKPDYAKRQAALRQLKNTQRYTITTTKILGSEIELVDAASFLFMYGEIFEQQIYKFKAQNQKPLIIDGGANIGLSVLYYKKLYPHSEIIAFEPDTKIFNILQNNVKKFNLRKIKLINKALWTSETVLEFMAEGADAGRVVQLESESQKYKVSTMRLREYLNQPVDFLKLDIEGAETEVLKDCQDLLGNVENLFVEYHSFVNQPQTLNVLVNILSNSGFRLHIHPPVTSPQPFYHRNIHMGMDMQLNIFAFRE